MNYVVYEGPSEITGDPVVAIISGMDRASENEKTGKVAQLWILHAEVHPAAALKTGQDAAICGTCPLRQGICYVTLMHGPNTIWNQWKKAKERAVIGFPPRAQTRNIPLRLAAYGDPAALPPSVIVACAERFKLMLGYTHLWRENPQLQPYVMASVETLDLAAEAQALGWRTFRIRPDTASPRVKGESLCPYESANLQCSHCKACNGKAGPFTSNIVVTVHGAGGKPKKFRQLF